MTDNSSPSGFELEEAGAYEEAAVAFARTGFKLLLNSEFKIGGKGTNEGIDWLLNSISCDRRVGNHRRLEYIGKLCLPLLEDERDTTADELDVGMVTELIGDVVLMLGTDAEMTASEYYDRAGEYFVDLDWRADLRTAEPLYDMGYRAIQHFSEFHDGPLPVNPETISFQERLDRKREFARQLREGDHQ